MEIQVTFYSIEGERSGEEENKRTRRLIITSIDVLYVILRPNGSHYCTTINVPVNSFQIQSYKSKSVRCTVTALCAHIAQKICCCKSGLRRHMKLVSGHFNYKYDVCDKTFNLKNYFVGHMNTHKGYKSYECQKCKKSFAYKCTDIEESQRMLRRKNLKYMCTMWNQGST